MFITMITSASFCLLPKFARILIHKHALCKRVAGQIRRISDRSNSAFTPPGIELYMDLQRYFSKRLRASYLRSSPVPNYSMVYGLHHVYFVNAEGIYKIDASKADQTLEQVLDTEQLLEKEQITGLQWSVQRVRLSPREKHLAVALREHHKEELRCLIISLCQETSSPRNHSVILTLHNVLSFEWTTDDVLFYTTFDCLRSSTVYCLDLTKKKKVKPVFEESTLDVFVELALTRDQKLLTINCSSRNSSEVLFIDRNDTSYEPCLVQRRKPDLLYHIEHWKGTLIILASTGPRQEYQVVQTLVSDPSADSWLPLYCPPPGYTLKDMDIVGDFCVLTTRTPDGRLGLTVMSLNKPDEVYFLELPSWAFALETKRGAGADTNNILEFLISSPIQPPLRFRLLPDEGLVLSDQGNKDFTEEFKSYNSERLEARSKDGTLVPITLFRAAHAGPLKEVPLLVHVYGSYGRDLNMEFCPKMRYLLKQGWALAYCHVRGGGECGLSWYREARFEGKHKSVEDLTACLEHLFSSGVSSSSLSALTACSAGALPVGALCNQHPHLIKAVTLQAPFLDLLGTLEDSGLPLTLEDREEWGDPVGKPEHKLTIAKYCPLQNITPQRYPSMLLTAYNADSRVPLGGIVKYAEKLQKAIHSYFSLNPGTESEQRPNVVLNIQPGADHQGQEDFDLMIKQDALELAFLYKELGLNHPLPARRKKR